MKCEFCGSDPQTIYLVPMPDGSRDVFSCRSCALAQGVYCERHEIRHTMFVQGGTACLDCIQEAVRAQAGDAEEIYRQILTALPEEERHDLIEWAGNAMEIMGDDSLAIPVLRSVLTEAFRRNLLREEVIGEVIASRSAQGLLPVPYPV